MNSEKQAFRQTRREFMIRSVQLGGAAAAVSFLPGLALAAPESATWRGQSPAPYRFTGMDEALGNYPGYSAAIGFGRGHLLAAVDRAPVDGQLYA